MATPTNSRIEEYLAATKPGVGRLSLPQRDELILAYAPLVRYVASRMAVRLPHHINLDDLISAGVLGLIDAVDKYDADKKTKFKTYAEFRIRGAILDELRALDWVPRSVRRKTARIEGAMEQVQHRLGRPATDEELADELGVGLDEYYRLLDESRGISLMSTEEVEDFFSRFNKERILELLGLDEADDPLALVGLAEVRDILAQAIDNLPEKEKLVVSLYYYDELTMKEIGQVLGYTESRISQMHTKAILRLRLRLKKYFDT
jgi:RNA polymerase sigma factor for flagellar operon FliA